MTVAEFLETVAALLVAISFVVLVHELAHLLAARLLALPAIGFSVGIGPALLVRNWGALQVRIGAMPMGGYVTFDDTHPRWREAALARAAMYAAGPLASLLLAVIVLASALTLGGLNPGLLSALGAALAIVGQLATTVVAGLTGIASDLNGMCDLSGPLDTLAIGREVVAGGPVLYLGMVGILSAGIALFNLLPIPVLDGGQILRAVFEAVTGMRMSGLLLRLWTTVGVAMLLVIASLAVLGDLICSQSTQL